MSLGSVAIAVLAIVLLVAVPLLFRAPSANPWPAIVVAMFTTGVAFAVGGGSGDETSADGIPEGKRMLRVAMAEVAYRGETRAQHHVGVARCPDQLHRRVRLDITMKRIAAAQKKRWADYRKNASKE